MRCSTRFPAGTGDVWTSAPQRGRQATFIIVCVVLFMYLFPIFPKMKIHCLRNKKYSKGSEKESHCSFL